VLQLVSFLPLVPGSFVAKIPAEKHPSSSPEYGVSDFRPLSELEVLLS
jgi:hypothetical protein